MKFLRKDVLERTKTPSAGSFPCISPASFSVAIVPLRFPFRFPKKKERKIPRSSDEKKQQKSFPAAVQPLPKLACSSRKKQNNTYTHVRPLPANICSTHQSPIPDRNPKSRVQLLSHSQIMMDDNLPQQSLRVPASFSRARQPGPGRTPLLSVFFFSRQSEPAWTPPRPHPAISSCYLSALLTLLREEEPPWETNRGRQRQNGPRSPLLLNPTNVPRFTCKEVKSTSDSLFRHIHNPPPH